jgi:hypothetical protein
MNEELDPDEVDSAIASWSGFIYQGKVALYHLLKLLCEDENSSRYDLQLDSLEDFAIRNGSDTLTIHQVKAVNSRYYSKFKKHFVKLAAKKVKYPCQTAYFHLAIKNEKTDIEIVSEHSTISLYQYSNDNFYCGLNEINDLIDLQISFYLKKLGITQNDNANNRIVLLSALEGLIFNQVMYMHSQNQKEDGLSINEAAFYGEIPFQNFIDLLTSEPSDLMDENYYLFHTKQLFNIWYLEFCNELEEDAEVEDEEVSHEIKNKLSKYLVQINTLDKEGLLRQIKNLIPHRNFKLESLYDFQSNNITKDEFSRAFLKGLHDLVPCKNEIKNGLIWLNESSTKHFLTAIYSPCSQKKEVAKDIYNNITQTDFEIPYNSEVLITSDITLESLHEVWNNRFQIKDDELEPNRNHIVKWSNIQLKSLAEIKDEINERND